MAGRNTLKLQRRLGGARQESGAGLFTPHSGADGGGGGARQRAPTQYLVLSCNLPPRVLAGASEDMPRAVPRGARPDDPASFARVDRPANMSSADAAAYEAWMFTAPSVRESTGVFLFSHAMLQRVLPFVTHTPCLLYLPQQGGASAGYVTGAAALHALVRVMVTAARSGGHGLPQTPAMEVAYKAAQWAEQTIPDQLLAAPLHAAHLPRLEMAHLLANGNSEESVHVEYVPPLSEAEQLQRVLVPITEPGSGGAAAAAAAPTQLRWSSMLTHAPGGGDEVKEVLTPDAAQSEAARYSASRKQFMASLEGAGGGGGGGVRSGRDAALRGGGGGAASA